MTKPIYLDYAATSPVAPEVAQTMQKYLVQTGIFANPASQHYYGWEAEQAVNEASQLFADAIGADADEIIWTSGATEANNLALKGAYYGINPGPAIITAQSEHPAVLEVCRFLEGQGAQTTYLKPDAQGIIDPNAIRVAQPSIISIMWVNNELGVIQDIKALAEVAHANQSILHVDAAQALGKLPINVHELGVDMMSFSGHKNYGPKGVGALYVQKALQSRLQPLLHGGGQQQGLRPGTLAPHLIVGMATATALSQKNLAQEASRQTALREALWAGIKELPGIARHGEPEHLAPHILCVSFEAIPAQQLLEALPNLAISSGSACHSASLMENHVLKSLGLNQVRAQNSLRLSVGRYTTESDIEVAIAQLKQAVANLNAAQESLWQLR